MALSRFGALRSSLRVSPCSTPVAAAGSCVSVLQAGDCGSQLRNQFSTRELQSSEWREGGLLFWMTRHMTSHVGTKVQLNMGSVGLDAPAKTSLTAAVTENLGNGGYYQRLLPVASVRGQHLYPFAASGLLNTAGRRGPGTQQIRTIMVEVKKNDLERAIRRWKRKCKEENLRALKNREYYMKPSEKRVLANKERDHRVAKKSFKQKLYWIMSRRQRGF